MQPVPDLQILDVAKIGIEPRQPVVLRHAGACAAFLEQAQRLRAVEDFTAQQGRAALVEAVGAGVFVDQPFQLQRRAVRPGGLQRRRQVADGDRAEPALGGRRLARVVDDEGVGDRDAAEQGRREAGLRHRDRLAGQPFQRAVRAEMDYRIDVFCAAEPQIEGDISVARRHIRVVIEGLAVADLAAVGLNRRDQPAEAPVADEEMPVLDRGIVFRPAPGLDDPRPGLPGQGPEQAAIGREAEDRKRREFAQNGDKIERRDIRRDLVAGLAEQRDDLDRALDRIQPDGVGELPGGGVVGQHHADPALAARAFCEPDPARGLFRRQRDPSRVGRVAGPGIFQAVFPLVLRLERDRGRREPAVQLRQHDLHGEVRLRETP